MEAPADSDRTVRAEALAHQEEAEHRRDALEVMAVLVGAVAAAAAAPADCQPELCGRGEPRRLWTAPPYRVRRRVLVDSRLAPPAQSVPEVQEGRAGATAAPRARTEPLDSQQTSSPCDARSAVLARRLLIYS